MFLIFICSDLICYSFFCICCFCVCASVVRSPALMSIDLFWLTAIMANKYDDENAYRYPNTLFHYQVIIKWTVCLVLSVSWSCFTANLLTLQILAWWTIGRLIAARIERVNMKSAHDGWSSVTDILRPCCNLSLQAAYPTILSIFVSSSPSRFYGFPMSSSVVLSHGQSSVFLSACPCLSLFLSSGIGWMRFVLAAGGGIAWHNRVTTDFIWG